MMQMLIRRVTYKLYLLPKMRPMLKRKASVAVYKSKVLSFMDYSLIFHFGSKRSYRNKLQVVQNHAIHINLRLSRHTNVDREHLNQGIWHVENRRNYFLLKLLHFLINKPQLFYQDNRNLETRPHSRRTALLNSF